MRCTTLLALAAGAALLALTPPAPASASGRNPDGYGLYSPAEPPVRGRPRLYRYDPHSWYYREPRYRPYTASDYWVPRTDMRYRFRYKYIGPKYRYFPAWGYDGCLARGRCY